MYVDPLEIQKTKQTSYFRLIDPKVTDFMNIILNCPFVFVDLDLHGRFGGEQSPGLCLSGRTLRRAVPVV